MNGVRRGDLYDFPAWASSLSTTTVVGLPQPSDEPGTMVGHRSFDVFLGDVDALQARHGGVKKLGGSYVMMTARIILA